MNQNYNNHKIYGVLTGDLIGSSKLNQTNHERIPAILQNVATMAKANFPDTILHDISIFRGDSWQLALQNPQFALRLALYIRASLISTTQEMRIDSRIGIGLGKIDYLPADNISAGNGEAFLLSSEALEKIRNREYTQIRYVKTEKEEYLNILLGLIDTISKDWSCKQALAIKGALQNLKQKDIAQYWDPPVSQQTVTRHLNRAGWENLERALQFFERIVIE